MGQAGYLCTRVGKKQLANSGGLLFFKLFCSPVALGFQPQSCPGAGCDMLRPWSMPLRSRIECMGATGVKVGGRTGSPKCQSRQTDQCRAKPPGLRPKPSKAPSGLDLILGQGELTTALMGFWSISGHVNPFPLAGASPSRACRLFSSCALLDTFPVQSKIGDVALPR